MSSWLHLINNGPQFYFIFIGGNPHKGGVSKNDSTCMTRNGMTFNNNDVVFLIVGRVVKTKDHIQGGEGMQDHLHIVLTNIHGLAKYLLSKGKVANGKHGNH